MADQKVNIKVTAQGAKKAQGELGGVSGAIGKMGKAVGIASTAYFGAKGLIAGFSSIITLAGEQEQAEKKLEVALGKTSKSLLDQATALQKMTAFGDEAIIGVQASIGAFIKNEEQIKKATSATLDIAVAMGMDLKSAGDLVAKTLGSSTNAMSRYGIEVTGAVGSTERLESLTGNVARLFGGQASAEAETLTGKIEQMKNAIGDAGEALGAVLAPAIVGIANVVTSFANGLSDIINFREGLAELAKDFEILTASQFKVIQLEQALKDMTKEDIIAKINELGLSVDQNDSSFQQMAITSAVLSEEQQALAEMATLLFEAYADAPEAIDNTKSAFDEYLASQKELIQKQEQEKANIEKLKREYPKLAESLGLVTKANAENTEQTKLAKMAEEERFVTSLSGARSLIKSLLARAVASLIAKEVSSKGVAGLITGSAGAIAVSALFDEFVPKFAQGGIVQGDSSKGDVVPVMATAGELILNQAQQENLVNSGITINISAPLVDETVVDSIIPAIERARRLGIA